MNPSFMALAKVKPLDMMKLLVGQHEPKGKKETSINGRAFAPGHGTQQEASGPEKEAKVTKHLDQLLADTNKRLGLPIPDTTGYVRDGYPCSDMVTEANETQAAK